MKNTLIISTTEEELLSNIDDGTNRLFINGVEIPSTDWVGTGAYTATIEGHSISITKIDTLSGNISLARVGAYEYEMRKRTPSGGGGGGGLYAFSIDNRGHLILTYEGSTPPDFYIDSNGHLIARL